MNRLVTYLSSTLAFGLILVSALASHATVVVSGPDPSASVVFFGLDIPPIGGALDERGFSGFEYRLSGRDPTVDEFIANDMYLIQGNDTNPTQAIGANIGDVDTTTNLHELSGVPINFSIQHNLVGGRNLTFSLFNTISMETSVLCWGLNCAPSSISAETINGEAPFNEFNGLQVQVRAQEVPGSTASVQITALNGISDIVGDPFYDETVDPTLPGTIQTMFGDDAGRRGQWLIADNLEFLTNEWELVGIVTLSRPDDAFGDRTKVRLAIDLVRDPELPFVVPEPSSADLSIVAITAVAFIRRASRRRQR